MLSLTEQTNALINPTVGQVASRISSLMRDEDERTIQELMWNGRPALEVTIPYPCGMVEMPSRRFQWELLDYMGVDTTTESLEWLENSIRITTYKTAL